MSDAPFIPTESFYKPRANKARSSFSLARLTCRVPASAIAFLAFGLNDGTAGVSFPDCVTDIRHSFHMYVPLVEGS